MVKMRRVSANLPVDLLEDMMKYTGKGVSETLVEALQQLKQRRGYEKLMTLKGKIHLNLDIDELRGRNRR